MNKGFAALFREGVQNPFPETLTSGNGGRGWGAAYTYRDVRPEPFEAAPHPPPPYKVFQRFLSSTLPATLLCATVLCALPPAAAESKCAPFKVGVTAALSGGLAPFGQSLMNGMLLSKKEHDHDNCISFIFEDDQFQVSKTVAAVHKFLNLEHVKALVAFGAGNSLAVNSLAENAALPMIAVALDPEVSAGKKYVFRHLMRPSRVGQTLAKEVLRRGYRRIALITAEQEAMLAVQKTLQRELSGVVALIESVPPEERDLSAVALRLQKVKPDGVCILVFPPQASLIAKQLRKTGYRGDLFGAYQFENADEIAAAGGALDDVWYVTGAVLSDPYFRQRYKATFLSNPESTAANGYDIAKLIIEGRRSSKPLHEYLRSVKDFKGVLGTYSATQENDFDLPVEVRTVREVFLLEE